MCQVSDTPKPAINNTLNMATHPGLYIYTHICVGFFLYFSVCVYMYIRMYAFVYTYLHVHTLRKALRETPKPPNPKPNPQTLNP